jgi:hypothetical protein
VRGRVDDQKCQKNDEIQKREIERKENIILKSRKSPRPAIPDTMMAGFRASPTATRENDDPQVMTI